MVVLGGLCSFVVDWCCLVVLLVEVDILVLWSLCSSCVIVCGVYLCIEGTIVGLFCFLDSLLGTLGLLCCDLSFSETMVNPKRRKTTAGASSSRGGGVSRGGASSSAGRGSGRAPQIDSMGLENLSDIHKQRWEVLARPSRLILQTYFVDEDVLAELGLDEAVSNLVSKGGLAGFLDKCAPTYTRFTMEFLSTVRKVEGGEYGEEKGIVFHLNDAEYHMTYTQVRSAFGWEYLPENGFGTDLSYNEFRFIYDLTHLTFEKDISSSTFRHPALRYVHRLLAMTVFAHGEPTKLSKTDLRLLWAFTKDSRGTPDWVDVWVTRCIKLSELKKRSTGKISVGGMVTLLANELGVELDVPAADRHLYNFEEREYSYTIDRLVGIKMISHVESSDEYYYSYGTGNVSFMRLPAPDRVAIPPGSLPAAGFFLLPDRNFIETCHLAWRGMGGVETIDEEDESGDEDYIPEGADVDVEQGDSSLAHGFRRAGGAAPVRGRGRLDALEGRMDGFEDRMDSMYHILDSLNTFHLTTYPGQYVDPAPAIASSRSQRAAERALRRPARRDPAEPSGS